MSALRPSPTTPGALLCPRCGTALAEDQAWCLECGLAARTRVHPPPSWRLPVLATFLVLAALAAGIAFALVALLDEPEPTPAPATVTVPAAAPTTPPTTVPTTTAPAATTPTTPVPGATTPTTTTPGASAPEATTTPTATTPAPAGARRTFRIPGTGIDLPATGD